MGSLFPHNNFLFSLLFFFSFYFNELYFKNSLIGIGEIVLLPLDVLKIKRQTNPESIAGKSLLQIIRQEGFGLYR